MKGIGVSPGIVSGKAILYQESKLLIVKKEISDVEAEIDRLNKAILQVSDEIDNLYEHTKKIMGEEEARIFTAHKMMIEDPDFISDIKLGIKEKKLNAEYLVREVANKFINVFENIEDEYLKERIIDLKDVTKRLLRALLNVDIPDLKNIKNECILVSKDLTPSDTAQMNTNKIIGIVTEFGGKTSHVSIMARNLGIPAVAGIKDITKKVKGGETIIIDGNKGNVIIDPSKEEIKKYDMNKKDYDNHRAKINKVKGKESISKDGVRVLLTANIGTPEDIKSTIENDGEGVGLYRTEFLYMDTNRMPSEEEQYNAYKIVAENLKGKPVTIRTLDIGGDKDIPYLEMPREVNPFLGYRAIRMCLDRVDMFRIQLRALLRASAYGDIKIMFPMISSIREIREAKAILKEEKDKLNKERIKINNDIEVGVMVEIPSTAIHSDIFAKEVDFFSIGTNDLIQYTLAVDRVNNNVAHLFNQYHPSVLRLIRMIIDNGHKEGIKVGMCGEAASDEKLIPLLLAMGLDEFSMNPLSLLKAKWIIRNTSKIEIEPMLDIILRLPTAEDVERFIDANILNKVFS